MTTSAAAARRTLRPMAGPLAAAAALVVASLYTLVRSPFQPGAFPVCLFWESTGLYCPGCGGLRAVHQLLHGDVAGAISLNALAILVVIPVTLVSLAWWLGNAAGRDWPPPRLHPALYWSLAAVVAAFWVLRNVGPFAGYLAP